MLILFLLGGCKNLASNPNESSGFDMEFLSLIKDSLSSVSEAEKRDWSAVRTRKRSAIEARSPCLSTLTCGDPYMSWLGAEIMARSVAGRLFYFNENIAIISLGWDVGDDSFWYIAEIVSSANRIDQWVLWPNYGLRVTPRAVGANPLLGQRAVGGICSGDIVCFRIYAMPRGQAANSLDIDIREAIATGSAQLGLQLSLPVVIQRSLDEGGG